MLIFDQLNKADRKLRFLSWCIAFGLVTLLAGLWWVQVVRSRHYVEAQSTQSYRTVRVPAPRGKILDRNGTVLAENRPAYSVSVYLGDRAWRDSVREHRNAARAAAQRAGATVREASAMEKFLSVFGYKPSLVQLRRISRSEDSALWREARYAVTSNTVAQLGEVIGQPLVLDPKNFLRHYEERRVLPMPVFPNLTAAQVARLQESGLRRPGVDMEIQPLRFYPNGTRASHVLGYLTRFYESAEDELSVYDYRLPDYRGLDGIEASMDGALRGKAGAKSVLVNNLGYRQSETILSPIEPGKNVTLTLDADIQRVAEKALSEANVEHPKRGAVVVLDVRTGEILAMASSPTHDPNVWIPRLPQEIWNTYTNEDIAPLRNRCVYGNYHPGSTFKTVVALAAIEAGAIDPRAIYRSPGHYDLGRRRIADTAGAGDFDFRRAFIKSSNPYFIHYGLQIGREAIVAMGERMHLGERTGIPLAPEYRGILPTREYIQKNLGGWHEGDTANLSIGQGYVDVTPLQMAVATAAVANGGRVLWPQLIVSVLPQDALIDPARRPSVTPRVRDQLPVSKRTLEIVQAAMLADTEDRQEGTGIAAHVDGYRICAKTGTAQVFNKFRQLDHWTVWFASYAPFENPRYAVVVMVDHGTSGGGTCGPVAKKIYERLKYRDQVAPFARPDGVARN